MLTRGIRQQRNAYKRGILSYWRTRRIENKLSPHYENEQYQVMAHHWDQIQLKSPQAVENKRNIQHFKQFVTPVVEPKGSSLSDPAEVQYKSHPARKMAASARQVEDQNPIQPQLLPRRSERVTRVPDGGSGFPVALIMLY